MGEYVGPFVGKQVSLIEAIEQGSFAWLFYFFLMGGVLSPIISAILCYLLKTRKVIASNQMTIIVPAFIPAFLWCLLLAFLKTLIGEW